MLLVRRQQQHELPPRKSRSVSVQAHGGGRRPQGVPCRGPASWQGLFPGGAGLPLRGEKQEHQHQEAGLWYNQKPSPQQGEQALIRMCSQTHIYSFRKVLIITFWPFSVSWEMYILFMHTTSLQTSRWHTIITTWLYRCCHTLSFILEYWFQHFSVSYCHHSKLTSIFNHVTDDG